MRAVARIAALVVGALLLVQPAAAPRPRANITYVYSGQLERNRDLYSNYGLDSHETELAVWRFSCTGFNVTPAVYDGCNASAGDGYLLGAATCSLSR